HGGQIILSAAIQELVKDELPPCVSMRNISLHRLRDLQRPDNECQLFHPHRPSASAPSHSLNLLPNNLPQPMTSFVVRKRHTSEPLALPDPTKLPSTLEALSQYEAVRLFIDRAIAVQPTFAVTNQNAPAVAQVCHRLDGIPLALELAAARVRSLPVERIHARL